MSLSAGERLGPYYILEKLGAVMPADKAEDPGVASHVTFLLNFFDELERRVLLKK